MNTTIETYPLFEANQVLSSSHLNALVEYLEEQERLTRANLIGIGISCGLQLELAPSLVRISRGCAVSSLGFLLIEHDDVRCTSFAAYTLPKGDGYAPFRLEQGGQIDLWELVSDGGTPLSETAGFLDGKSVLLFLERDEQDLSDCSPNNCDDKGREATFTLRRLVVRDADVKRLAGKLRGALTDSARKDLPKLRLLRYDTPRTNPVTTRDVLEAFQHVVKKSSLVTELGQALSKGYEAFEPILRGAHPANPFTTFQARFGFLESAPDSVQQVRSMPHYMDLFADLVLAYEEFRRCGLEYDCTCCPAGDWFPRHVVLGPKARTGWFPASACCGCEPRRRELLSLFTRLVRMVQRFDAAPETKERSRLAFLSLRDRSSRGQTVRITPSRAGTEPLSERCIPHYYDFSGNPPLYRLWNPSLTEQGRAHHNQAYRCNEFAPAPPSFVRTPLVYDLEPYDFLRIEGHLGQRFDRVLARLQELRDSHRLPFDVVALRTGRVDESLEVDPTQQRCRFQDLEAAFDMLRDEVLCLTRKAIAALGRHKLKSKALRPADVPVVHRRSSISAAAAKAKVVAQSPFELVKDLVFEPDTIGSAFLGNLKQWGRVDFTLVKEPLVVNTAFSILNQLQRLMSLLSRKLYELDWDAIDELVRQLQQRSAAIAEASADDGADDGLSWKELTQHLLSVVYACRLEGFQALRAELVRRIREVRRLSYLEGYAQQHPAIQHKAGVPIGGTFILVYHAGSERDAARGDVYDEALRQLDDGVVIADFCLPYRCCSDCSPIQFVITAPPEARPAGAPQLEAVVACTIRSQAQVTISASGGTPPYELTVDGGEPLPLSDPVTVSLAEGTRVLRVKDSEGVQGAPVTLEIPEALTAADPAYTDNPDGTFQARFAVSGGVPPYTASQGVLEADNSFRIDGLQSGTNVLVTVTDAAGCAAEVRIAHEVAPTCDKPCKGQATRARYPAWAPRPTKSTGYGYKSVDAWKLSIGEQGNLLFERDLAEIVFGSVSIEGGITVSNYVSVMTKVCKRISEEVAAALGDEYGRDAWSIVFDKETGTLVIESYSCHEFSIGVDFAIHTERGFRSERWSYARDGIRVVRDQPTRGEYSMPAFGVIALDKCADTEGKDCRIDLQGFEHQRSGNLLSVGPRLSDTDSRRKLAFHWRVDGDRLVSSDDPQIRLRIESNKAMHVQLLVVETGTRCWGFAETWIEGEERRPVPVPRRRPR